ncbi:hypothetical protein FRUB_04334 [Fimbriiglobus ruber]|uniref:Uncharacterized protein n=1 Tax=Fimbriiglobus ruber TaxID=1908690 RepID=A0A225DX39_9BACT|nr:hypothetical protein FRUB_04334 [Fimbriiglobus ruber]
MTDSLPDDFPDQCLDIIHSVGANVDFFCDSTESSLVQPPQ